MDNCGLKQLRRQREVGFSCLSLSSHVVLNAPWELRGLHRAGTHHRIYSMLKAAAQGELGDPGAIREFRQQSPGRLCS